MTDNTTTDFKVGDRVSAKNSSRVGAAFRGLVGTVTEVRNANYILVNFDAVTGDETFQNGGSWGTDSLNLESRPVEGPRSSLQHETSREYADRARSRTLSPWVNEVLKAAAAGEEVDVVTFRKAATAALSLASTRAGQSMGRRVWAKEARHLIYWADAIIDNHIAGLPPMEPGARSPKIKALEDALEKLREESASNTARLEQDIDNERERIVALIREKTEAEIQVANAEERLKKVKAAANSEVSDLTAKVANLRATSDWYTARHDGLKAALAYARSFLTKERQQRVDGYLDARMDVASGN